MILIVILALVKLDKARKKTSNIVFYVIRLLGLYALVLKTIAPIPLFNIFLAAIFCNSYNTLVEHQTCFQDFNLFCFIIGIIGLVTTILFSLAAELFCIDLNPNSTAPFAAPLSNINLAKLLLKFVLPFYLVIDVNVSFSDLPS